MSATIAPTTGSPSTVSVAPGTFAAQAVLAYGPDTIQRLEIAIGLSIQSILGEDPTVPNHANRATWARDTALAIPQAAANLVFALVADGSITGASTDQQVYDHLQSILAGLIFPAS